jgi:hypothetical protein
VYRSLYNRSPTPYWRDHLAKHWGNWEAETVGEGKEDSKSLYLGFYGGSFGINYLE